MINVSSLSLAELRSRLEGDGIFLRTGCFVTKIQSSILSIAEGLRLLYADYQLDEQGGFADFHISLHRPKNVRYWFKPQVLFCFDGVSTFKPLPLDQAFPMLEWGLNWCISGHAHRFLIIHAAVVERNGLAAIMPAPPGSGKSTLCAALVNRGWRLLSDELAMIRIDDGKIVPIPRPVSLKNASIDVMKAYAPQAVFSRSVFDTMKGTVAHMKAPHSSVKESYKVAQPAWVIFPKYVPNSAPLLTPLSRAQAFMQVADNAFNYSLLGIHGFEALAGVMNTSFCYSFSYSQLDDAIHAFEGLA